MFSSERQRVLCVGTLSVCLRSEPVVLVIVAVNGYTAVVGDWPRHGGHPCDDACRWVVTQDGVGGFAIFPSSTEDEDLTVAHRHATALLHREVDIN